MALGHGVYGCGHFYLARGGEGVSQGMLCVPVFLSLFEQTKTFGVGLTVRIKEPPGY